MAPSGSEPDNPGGGETSLTWSGTPGRAPERDTGGASPTLAPEDAPSGPFELRTHETWTEDGERASPPPARDREEAGTDAFIGSYRVLGVLGEGGMGTVYKAEQRNPRRLVAVKVIRNAVATPAMRRRFEFEAQVLARLDHPGIARIYECVTDGPRSWFAMEYVEGRCLDAFIDEEELDLREILDLLARVADAVHHAHLRGIIHRDLKPGNILVTDAGEPRVLDFGIARAVEVDELDPARHTRAGQVVGTPAYMSPEQASIEQTDIDARSDVYALGVIAYQVLGRQLPLDFSELSLPAVLRTIAEVEPKRLGRVDRSLRGEVEAIVHRAMEKDREERYQSAAALADDLRRYLADEPIQARPATATYALWKFVRRNRVLSAGFAAWITTVCVAAFVLAALLVQTAALYRSAQASAAALAARNDALVQLQARTELERDPTRAVAWLGALPPGIERPGLHGLVHEAEARGLAADLLVGHGHEVRSAAVADDGQVVTAGYDGTARLWNPTDRSVRVHAVHGDPVKWAGFHPVTGAAYTLGEDGGVWRLDDPPAVLARVEGGLELGAFAPDGRFATAGDGGTVVILDPGGAEVGRFAIDGPAEALAFPDALFAVDRSGTLWTWTSDGARRIGAHPGRVADLDVGADGTLVTASFDGSVRIWDLATGASEELHRHEHEPRGVRWVGTDHLVSTDRSGAVRIWERTTGALQSWQGHQGVVRTLERGPAGRFATGGADGVVRVWTVDGLSHRLLGHSQRVRQVGFSPDGSWLVSASSDGSARLWRIPEGPGALPEPGARRTAVAWAPDGSPVWVDSAGGLQRSVDGAARRWVAHGDESETAAWAGELLVTGSRDGTVRAWRGKDEVWVGRWHERIDQVAAAGDRVAAAGRLAEVPLWTIGRDEPEVVEHPGVVKRVAFDATGTWLAAGGDSGVVGLWRVGEGSAALHGRSAELRGEIGALAWSPAGVLAAGDDRGGLVLLRPEPGTEPWSLTELREGGGPVLSIAWSPGGERVAVGSGDGAIRIYGGPGFELEHTLSGEAAVLSLAWGERLWSGDDAGAVRRWDLDTGRSVVLTGPAGPVLSLALSPSGAEVAAAADEREWIWSTQVPDAEGLRRRIASLTRCALDERDVLGAPWTSDPAGR